MILRLCALLIATMGASAVCIAAEDAGGWSQELLISFDRDSLPQNMTENNTKAAIVPHEGRRAMRVDFEQVDWPNVFFTPPDQVGTKSYACRMSMSRRSSSGNGDSGPR